MSEGTGTGRPAEHGCPRSAPNVSRERGPTLEGVLKEFWRLPRLCAGTHERQDYLRLQDFSPPGGDFSFEAFDEAADAVRVRTRFVSQLAGGKDGGEECQFRSRESPPSETCSTHTGNNLETWRP